MRAVDGVSTLAEQLYLCKWPILQISGEEAFIIYCWPKMSFLYNTKTQLNPCRAVLKILQSWPKISAPLQFCQKMQHFSQKIVPVANVLVFMCLLFLFALQQHKKSREEKSNLLKFHTELKNELDKMIDTLSKLKEIIAFEACDAPVICI